MKKTLKTVPMSFRLKPELKQHLQEMADRENRSLTNFIETQLFRMVEKDQKEQAGA